MSSSSSSSSNPKKNIIKVFSGKFCLPPPSPLSKITIKEKNVKANKKVVVFDLDETLGSFGDLHVLWCGIRHICPSFNDFNSLLDLYPEFLRYGIISILQFLYEKKITGECEKIYIYTNNQCSSEWVSLIANYFKYKVVQHHHTTEQSHVEIELIDKVIRAFKIGMSQIEMSRTSHKKTFCDLIRCTMLPKTTEFCFLDDTEYERMKHDKVFYICPKPYAHYLTIDEIIRRWISSSHSMKTGLITVDSIDISLLNSNTYWYSWFSTNGRLRENIPAQVFSPETLASNVGVGVGDGDRIATNEMRKSVRIQLDKLVSQKMMYFLKEFFILSTLHQKKIKNHKRKTSKMGHSSIGSKTRRRRAISHSPFVPIS